jgi:hypothetical protein
MNRLLQHKLTQPTPANPHFGTFPFFQPRLATALKNVKEPKFSNRTPAATIILIIYSFSNTLFHFELT